MSYRIQEILRMIIPGVYLIAMLLILILIGGEWNVINDTDKNTIIDVLKGASNVVALLLPFLGFVTGYLVECVMSFVERLLYVMGMRRPSKVVLRGTKFYVLSNLTDIKRELAMEGEITNCKASEALQKAKQKIERQTVDMFHETSIMARNIMGSQLILTVFVAFNCGLLTNEFYGMIVMLLILSVYWYHRNCIYVKYVFFEFGKTINQHVADTNPCQQ